MPEEVQTGGYVVVRVPEGGFEEIGHDPEARDHEAAMDEVLPSDAQGEFIAFPSRTYNRAKSRAVKITVENKPVRSVERLFDVKDDGAE